MTRPLGVYVERAVRLPRLSRYARALVDRCDPEALVVDLGCGDRSPVRSFIGGRALVGVDSQSFVLERARRSGTHDEFVQADLLDALNAVEQTLAGREVQLVCLLHVIEHLPKRVGFEVLERAEALTSRFVLVDTPNRFLPQGPEYGNAHQRHLSGWFDHDFIGLGYDVHGTAGTRYLRGYAGEPRIPVRGGESVDFVLARALWIERFPRHAYNLTAYKDVRGVPARLG